MTFVKPINCVSAGAVVDTLLNDEDCDISDPLNPDFSCLLDPEGDFKREWNECIKGELTAEEQVWSNRLVKAWTNFAKYG